MDVYNTTVMVVANLEAQDEDAAITALSGSLIDHGFDTITDAGKEPVAYISAFVAEDGTEPMELPPVRGYIMRDDYDRLPPRGLAGKFTPDEVEALILAAADLWGAYSDGYEVLSTRQCQVAQRALELRDERMGG